MCRLLKPMAFKEQSPLTPGEHLSRSRYCRVCLKLQNSLNSSLPNRNKACGCCLKYSNSYNRTSRAASNAGAELFFFFVSDTNRNWNPKVEFDYYFSLGVIFLTLTS